MRPSGSIPICFNACIATVTTPREVAPERPCEPPIETGLPVTTPGTEYPEFIE